MSAVQPLGHWDVGVGARVALCKDRFALVEQPDRLQGMVLSVRRDDEFQDLLAQRAETNGRMVRSPCTGRWLTDSFALRQGSRCSSMFIGMTLRTTTSSFSLSCEASVPA